MDILPYQINEIGHIIPIDNCIHFISVDQDDHQVHAILDTESMEITHIENTTKCYFVDQAIHLRKEKSIFTFANDNIYKYFIEQRKWIYTGKVSDLHYMSYSPYVEVMRNISYFLGTRDKIQSNNHL